MLNLSCDYLYEKVDRKEIGHVRCGRKIQFTLEQIEAFVSDHSVEAVDWSEKVTVIHPGSGSAGKCWHLDNFLAVANKLRRKGHHVVFLLGPAELERFDRADRQKIETTANCLTDLSLTEVIGLLSCAHCFIGNDTGITHLAAGIGTRTIAMFGPTDPKVYGPIGPDVIILIGNETTFAESPSKQLQQQVLEAVEV